MFFPVIISFNAFDYGTVTISFNFNGLICIIDIFVACNHGISKINLFKYNQRSSGKFLSSYRNFNINTSLCSLRLPFGCFYDIVSIIIFYSLSGRLVDQISLDRMCHTILYTFVFDCIND